MGSDKNALLVTSIFDINDSHNLPAPLLAWHSRAEKVGSKCGGCSWWQQVARPPHHYAMHNPGTRTHPEFLVLPGLSRECPVEVGLNHTAPAVLTIAGVHSLTFCKVGHVRCYWRASAPYCIHVCCRKLNGKHLSFKEKALLKLQTPLASMDKPSK